MYNKTLWWICVTILARESNNEFTWYCWDAYVTVNYVKLLSVAKEMQKWVAFALLSGYEILLYCCRHENT
jgi:predicted phosphoadenosine phosphosulfate sulfurtransferase